MDEFDRYKIKPKEVDEFDQYKIKKEVKSEFEQKEFDWGLALKNLGTGGWQKLKDIVNPQTYTNLLKSIELLSPRERIEEGPQKGFYRNRGIPKELVGSIAQDFANKYGSLEKAKQTFQNTPVEPILDASTVLTGGGSILAKAPGIAGKVGGIAQKVGMVGEPINIVSAPIKALSPLIQRAASRIQSSAIKLSKKIDIEDMDRTIQRSLDEGIYISKENLNELKGKMDQVRKEINSQFTGGEKFVDTWRAADAIDEMKQQYLNRFIRDPELEQMFENIKTGLIETHGERIPAKIAQQMKMSTQQFLAKAYDKLSAYNIEAEKYVTANVRMQLEELHPQLKLLNPKMQEYNWLKNAIEDQVKTRMTRQLAPGISFWRFMVDETVDNPTIKSNVAIALNKINKLNKFSPSATFGRQAILQTANPMEEAMKYLQRGEQ